MHIAIQNRESWLGAPRFAVTGVWTPHVPAVESGSPTSSGVPLDGFSLGCDCQDSGLGLLGAATLTPDAAMQQAIQMGSSSGLKLNPNAFQNNSWLSKAESQIAAGAFDISWYSGSCGAQSAPNMNLLTTASGIGLSAGGAADAVMVATHAISAATGAIVGAATMGVGVLISVIAMIFQHHAAAVKRDLSFGCGALPAVNNAFAVINQAVHSGQTTPAAAAQSLDQIYTEYQSAGGAAINNHPWCNSNCEMGVILKAMVLYWQSQYAAMSPPATAATAQSTATPGGSTQTGVLAPGAAGQTSGISPIFLIGALVLGVFLLR